MAVCEIWDVRGRLDHPIDYAENPEKTANPKYTEADLQALGDVMKYATNGDKTEKQFFVTGVNCDTATARDEMLIAKASGTMKVKLSAITVFRALSLGSLRQNRLTRSALNLPRKCGATDFKSLSQPTLTRTVCIITLS